MKKLFLLISTLIIFNSIFAQKDLTAKLDSLLSDSFFEQTIVSLDSWNLTLNAPLYSKNSKLLLRPASNMKILTSIAGLIFLGSDHSFVTSLYNTGKIEDGNLNGDVFIEGGFDPDFTTFDLDSLIAGLKELGVEEIRGNIYADISSMDSLIWGKGWMWDDEPDFNFPYFTPLNINDNCIEITIEPGELGSPAKVEINPKTGFIKLFNFSKTIKNNFPDSVLTVTRDWVNRKNDIIVYGKISLKERKRRRYFNLFDPAKYFLTLFQERLEYNKIKFNGSLDKADLPKNAKLIAQFKRPYIGVINNLNKESDNLSAEMTLRALGYYYFGKPSSAEKGIKVINNLISFAGFNPEDYVIADGSGVSHYNLISTQLILGILKYIYFDLDYVFQPFYNSLPIGGIDGTLKTRMSSSPIYNNVRAKTGTLSGVSSLSGYLTANNGDLIAFSIMMQNYTGSSSRARFFQDEICRVLAESK